MGPAIPDPSVQLIASQAQTPRHDQEGHIVQLYKDDGFLLDVLSRFVGGALAVSEGYLV